MAMLPTLIISLWLGGLLSFGIIGGGIYLIYEWYRRAWVYNPQFERSIASRSLVYTSQLSARSEAKTRVQKDGFGFTGGLSGWGL